MLLSPLDETRTGMMKFNPHKLDAKTGLISLVGILAIFLTVMLSLVYFFPSEERKVQEQSPANAPLGQTKTILEPHPTQLPRSDREKFIAAHDALVDLVSAPEFSRFRRHVAALDNDAVGLFNRAMPIYEEDVKRGRPSGARFEVIFATVAEESVTAVLKELPNASRAQFATDVREQTNDLPSKLAEAKTRVESYAQDGESIAKYQQDPMKLLALLSMAEAYSNRATMEYRNENLMDSYISIRHADMLIEVTRMRLAEYDHEVFRKGVPGRP